MWHWPGDRLGTIPPQTARDAIHDVATAQIGVQPTLQSIYGDESIFDDSLLNDPRLKESLPAVLISYH